MTVTTLMSSLVVPIDQGLILTTTASSQEQWSQNPQDKHCIAIYLYIGGLASPRELLMIGTIYCSCVT